MIGADVFRWWLAGNGMIEHPAYRDAINWSGFDAKADESSRKDVHNQHYPVTAQEDRFAAEEIDAPEAVLDVPDEGEPGRTTSVGIAGKVVLREYTAHNIFVDAHPEGVRDLLGNAYTAEPGVAALQLNDRRDEFRGGTFRTRVCGDGTRRKRAGGTCDPPTPCGT